MMTKQFLYLHKTARTLLLLAVCLLQLGFSIAQGQRLEGIVLDRSQQPIPYANIILPGMKTGTFSNEKGQFILLVDELQPSEIIVFSCLGYSSRNMTVKNFRKEGKVIVLKESLEKLEEVVLSASKRKTITRGKTRTKTNDMRRYGSSFRQTEWNEPGYEMGRMFRLGTRKISYLKELRFFIRKNSFDKTILKINIYDVQNDLPSNNLLPSNLVVTAEDQFTGWITVDLRDYNLRAKGEIIATVEFVKAEPNCSTVPIGCGIYFPYIYPTISTPSMYIKDGVKEDWEIEKGSSLAMTLTYQQ